MEDEDQNQDGSDKDFFNVGDDIPVDFARNDAVAATESDADSDASVILSSQPLSNSKSGKKKLRRKSPKVDSKVKRSKASGSLGVNEGHQDDVRRPDVGTIVETCSEVSPEPLRLPRLNLAKVYKVTEFSLPKEFTSLKLEHTRMQV